MDIKYRLTGWWKQKMIRHHWKLCLICPHTNIQPLISELFEAVLIINQLYSSFVLLVVRVGLSALTLKAFVIRSETWSHIQVILGSTQKEPLFCVFYEWVHKLWQLMRNQHKGLIFCASDLQLWLNVDLDLFADY